MVKKQSSDKLCKKSGKFGTCYFSWSMPLGLNAKTNWLCTIKLMGSQEIRTLQFCYTFIAFTKIMLLKKLIVA